MFTIYYICSMNKKVGEYINALISHKGCSQADVARAIGVPRALLSYIILERRELSIQVALKLESYFDLPEGELVRLQAMSSIKKYKEQIRESLCRELIDKKAFWSYSNISPESISDEDLIEKTLTYLDLGEISKLFELFKREYVKRIWRSRMVVQGAYLSALNIMIALYYFDIKQPEKYIQRVEREHLKNMLQNA
jgi:plasmid maintenance system antidote protein VapI